MSLHLSPSHSRCLGPHEFTLVFHLSATLVSHSGCLGAHEFTLVSHTCLPHSGCLGPHELHLSPTCLPHLSPTLGALGRMILHLLPTCPSHLGALGRMSLHLFSTCLPHLSSTLVSHSGCLGPHKCTEGCRNDILCRKLINIFEIFYICLGPTLV